MENQDTVYVIYLDNKMYKKSNRKVAYLKISSAKQIITIDSEKIAEQMVYENKNNKNYKCWYDLDFEEKQKWINKARSRFEIKDFVERRQ